MFFFQRMRVNSKVKMKHSFSLKKSVNRKIFSALTAVVFTFGSVLGDTPLWAQNLKISAGGDLGGISLQSTLAVPAELGQLRDYYVPENADAKDIFVFHIQDAHANPDAQQKIREILHWLDQSTPATLSVSLEGGINTVHPEYLEMLPEFPEANEAVVKKLASQGELNGVELYAWDLYKNGTKSPAVYGAEDAPLYRENLKTYRELLFSQQDIDTLLTPFRKQLEIAKSRILSVELRDFLRERQRRRLGEYEGGSSLPQLSAYLTFLSSRLQSELQVDLNDRFEQIRFPNLVRLLTLGELEKQLDSRKAQSERKTLHAKLSSYVRTQEDRQLMEDLQKIESAPEPRRIGEAIWALGASYRVNPKDYAAFWKYMGTLVLKNEIEASELFAELDQLESWLIAHWVKNAEQRRLIDVLEKFELLEKLLSLKWTTDDQNAFEKQVYEVLEAVLGNAVPDLLAGDIKSSESVWDARTQALMEGYIEKALVFYEKARLRDEALIRHTLQNSRDGKVVALISGGFHTDGLTSLMRQKGIGYAVIQPRILKTDGGALYHKVLRDENADISSYFGAPVLNKQTGVFFRALIEAAAPVLWEHYQVPHLQIAGTIANAVNNHEVLRQALRAETVSETSNDSSLRLQVIPERETPEAGASLASMGVLVAPNTLHPNDFSQMYARVEGDRVSTTGDLSAPAQSLVSFRPAGLRVVARSASPAVEASPATPSRFVPDQSAAEEQLARSELRARTDDAIFRKELGDRIEAFLKELYGSRYEDAIKEEAVVTERDPYVVKRGIIGRKHDEMLDDDWYMARSERGPPATLIWIGGGGEGATVFALAVTDAFRKRFDFKTYKKQVSPKRLIMINSGTYDDGGDTGGFRMELENSDEWPNYLGSIGGDKMSALWLMAFDQAKKDFLDDSFRIDAVVNVNVESAEELRKHLRYVLSDESLIDAILEERAANGMFKKEDYENRIKQAIQSKIQASGHSPEIAKEQGAYIFGRIKKTLSVDKPFNASVIEAVKKRIKAIQLRINSGLIEEPADWAFFVANMLAMAEIVQRQLIDTNDLKLIGRKWQNLMDAAVQIDVGKIQRRESPDKPVVPVEANIEPYLKIYEALGIPLARIYDVSNDDAVQSLLLEAATVRFEKAGEEASPETNRIFQMGKEQFPVETGNLVVRLVNPDTYEMDGDGAQVFGAPLRKETYTSTNANDLIHDPSSPDKVAPGKSVRIYASDSQIHTINVFDQPYQVRRVGNELQARRQGTEDWLAVALPDAAADVLSDEERFLQRFLRFHIHKDTKTMDVWTTDEIVFDENDQEPVTIRVFDKDVTVQRKGDDVVFVIDGKEMRVTEQQKNDGTVLDQGKTTVIQTSPDSAVAETEVLTSADWTPVPAGIEGISRISLKSRLVEEQTYITDQILAARPFRLFFKTPVRNEQGKYVYKTDGDMALLDASGSRGQRTFVEMKDENKPQLAPEVKAAIENAQLMAVTAGESGMVTSQLPNYLVGGTVASMRKQTESGVPFIVYPKLTQDFETMGWSFSEQILLLDRSIEAMTGEKNGYSGLITDVILPVIPKDIEERQKQHHEETVRVFKAKSEKGVYQRREEKLSKGYPLESMTITKEDEEFFKSRGIRIHYISSFDFNTKGKLVFDKKELYEIIDMIAVREVLFSLISDPAAREALRNKLAPSDPSKPYSRPIFFGISEWNAVFETVGKTRPANELEKVTFYFNRGSAEEKRFEISVPAERFLSDKQKAIVHRYISMYLYNRLVVWGPNKVEIDSENWIFDELKRVSSQAGSGFGLLNSFLGHLNNKPLTLDQIGSKTVLPAVQPEVQSFDRQKFRMTGSVVGLSLSGAYIRGVHFKDGRVIKSIEREWSPGEYDQISQYTQEITDFIRDNLGIKKLEEIDRIGISWPSPIRDNMVISRAGEIVSLFSDLPQNEFESKIGLIGRHLSEAFGGKPVTLSSYGESVAFKYAAGIYMTPHPDAQGFSGEKTRQALFFDLGEGVASGYLDQGNLPASLLGELGNLIVDTSVDAPQHSFTGVQGVLQQYLSYQGIRRLSQQMLMGDLLPTELLYEFGFVYHNVAKKFETDNKGALPQGVTIENLLSGKIDLVTYPQLAGWKSFAGMELRNKLLDALADAFYRKIIDLKGKYKNISTIFFPNQIVGLDGKPDVLSPYGSLTQNETDEKGVIRDEILARVKTKLISAPGDLQVSIVMENDLTPRQVIDELNQNNDQARAVLVRIGEYLADAIYELNSNQKEGIVPIRHVYLGGSGIEQKSARWIAAAANKRLEVLHQLYGNPPGSLVQVTILYEFEGQAEYDKAIGAAAIAVQRAELRSDETAFSDFESDEEQALFKALEQQIANPEQSINRLLEEGKVGQAIEVFTLERGRLDNAAVQRITAKLDAAYQGPVTVVGKLGGTSMAFEGGTEHGLLGFRVKEDTLKQADRNDSESEIVARIADTIAKVIQHYGDERVERVHFSAPGFYKPDGTLFVPQPNIPGLKAGFSFEKSVGEELSERFGRTIEVRVIHDGTAGALGELSIFGGAFGENDLFYVIAGTGIGTRRIQEGAAFLGDESVNYLHNEGPHHMVFNGNAENPDFTYIGVESQGRHPNYTDRIIYRSSEVAAFRERLSGFLGSLFDFLFGRLLGQVNPYYGMEDLEDRTSGPALARYARTVVESGLAANNPAAQNLLERAEGNLGAIDARILGEAAKEGNLLARQIIQERGRELGIGLAAFLLASEEIWPDFTMPERVIIGSGVAQIGDIFLSAVQQGFSQRFAKAGTEVPFSVELSKIQDDTAREFYAGLPRAELRSEELEAPRLTGFVPITAETVLRSGDLVLDQRAQRFGLAQVAEVSENGTRIEFVQLNPTTGEPIWDRTFSQGLVQLVGALVKPAALPRQELRSTDPGGTPDKVPERLYVELDVPAFGLRMYVREGGLLSVDIGKAPQPTKPQALAHLIDSLPDVEANQVVYLGNQNTSIADRDGQMAQLADVRVKAVDEDQDGVFAHPQIEKIGGGVEATQRYLEYLASLPEADFQAQNVKLIGFDIDDTVLSGKSIPQADGGTKIVDESFSEGDRPGIMDAVLALERRGVKFAFLTDNDAAKTQRRVSSRLKELHEAAGINTTVYFYTSGMATKFDLVQGTSGTFSVEYDRAYGEQFRLPPQVVSTFLGEIGSITENADGSITATGLIGKYYSQYFAELVPGSGKYQLRPETVTTYSKFKPGTTANGNVTPPGIQRRDPVTETVAAGPSESLAQITLFPIASRSMNDNPASVGGEDIRGQLVWDIIEMLQNNYGATIISQNRPRNELRADWEDLLSRFPDRQAAEFWLASHREIVDQHVEGNQDVRIERIATEFDPARVDSRKGIVTAYGYSVSAFLDPSDRAALPVIETLAQVQQEIADQFGTEKVVLVPSAYDVSTQTPVREQGSLHLTVEGLSHNVAQPASEAERSRLADQLRPALDNQEAVTGTLVGPFWHKSLGFVMLWKSAEAEDSLNDLKREVAETLGREAAFRPFHVTLAYHTQPEFLAADFRAEYQKMDNIPVREIPVTLSRFEVNGYSDVAFIETVRSPGVTATVEAPRPGARAELRDLAANSAIDALLKPQTPETVSTQQTIDRALAFSEDVSSDARISESMHQVAENAGTIYDTYAEIARILNITQEEAFALVVRALVTQSIVNGEAYNEVLGVAREILGEDLFSALVETADKPVFVAQDLTMEELQSDEEQLLFAFTLLAKPLQSYKLYVDGDEPLDRDAVLAPIIAKLEKFGGNAKILDQRVQIEVIPHSSLDEVRRMILRDAMGRHSNEERVVLSRNARLLDSFGVVRNLGRLDRKNLSYSRANFFVQAVSLRQDVVDMLQALESRGFSREDIMGRLGQLMQALQKIATAA